MLHRTAYTNQKFYRRVRPHQGLDGATEEMHVGILLQTHDTVTVTIGIE